MIKKIAEAIVEHGQDNNIDIQLYEEYSGKGMFGEKTTAITCASWKKFNLAVFYTALEFQEQHKYDGLLIQLEMAIEEIREDNLGRDIIIY